MWSTVTFFFTLTLFVTISIEDSKSWDMECLRTPLGAGAKGVKEDGERGGGGEFRVYKGMTLSRCDSPASSITWLLVRLGEGVDPSVRRETGELSFQHNFSHMCQLRPTTSNLCQLKCLKHLILQTLFSPLSASFPSLIFSARSLSSLLSADWCCLFLFSWTLLFSAELIRISAGYNYKQITG